VSIKILSTHCITLFTKAWNKPLINLEATAKLKLGLIANNMKMSEAVQSIDTKFTYVDNNYTYVIQLQKIRKISKYGISVVWCISTWILSKPQDTQIWQLLQIHKLGQILYTVFAQI